MNDFTRRDLLIGGAAVLATATLPAVPLVAEGKGETSAFRTNTKGEFSMATITTKDGATIFYKDWGKGQPIVFSHGWPLTADDWDAQMLFFGQLGYRVIAHDRRGHGRSTQTWDGNDMDTYPDDLAQLTEKLDLKNAIHVGPSTDGGRDARDPRRHVPERDSQAGLQHTVAPLMRRQSAKR